MTTYKVVLLGDSNTGKTAFVHHAVTGNWTPEKHPNTFGVDVHEIQHPAKTNTYFTMWDIQGGKPGNALQVGCCMGADAALIFCDLLSSNSVKNVQAYYKMFRTISDTPVVVVNTKTDLQNQSDMTLITNLQYLETFVWKNDLFFCQISSKNSSTWKELFTLLDSAL